MSQSAGDPSLESALSCCSESRLRHKCSSVSFKTGLGLGRGNGQRADSVGFRRETLAQVGTFTTWEHERSHLDKTEKESRLRTAYVFNIISSKM